MTFLDEINNAKKEQADVNEAITTEIVDWFIVELESKEFEDKLKDEIIRNIKYNGKTTLDVSFWLYHPGCSSTNFHVSCCDSWKNGDGYDSWYYKGVFLKDLSKKITYRVLMALQGKLHDLGLSWDTNYVEGSLGYPRYDIHIKI